jgi:uncharacterized protein YndB with AHSA1/START domain
MKRLAVALGLALASTLASLLAMPAIARAGEIELSAAEAKLVATGETLIRATLDPDQRRGTVRAAVLIDAPPSVVFHAMTRCTDAYEYVPHLKRCSVREAAPDGSWNTIDHEIDFGWYTPRIRWTFRADFVTDRRIAFKQVKGDFRGNEGLWELEPEAGGARTLLKYRAAIDPPGFIPNWLVRSTYKRELPRMLEDLRQLCEARHRDSAPAR